MTPSWSRTSASHQANCHHRFPRGKGISLTSDMTFLFLPIQQTTFSFVHTGEKETQLCSHLRFSTQEKLGDLWYRGGLVPNARSTRGLIERYSPFLALASSCVTWFLCHQSINDVLLAEIVRRQRWQRRFFRCVCFFTANVTDSFWSMQMASPRLHQTPNTHRCERIISMFSWLRTCRSTLRAEDLFVAGCASIAAGFFLNSENVFLRFPWWVSVHHLLGLSRVQHPLSRGVLSQQAMLYTSTRFRPDYSYRMLSMSSTSS